MFKFGLFVSLLCLAIFIEDTHSCFANLFGTPGPVATGRKKRDVEAVVEVHGGDVDNVDPVVEIQEVEHANKFTGRNVHAKKEYGIDKD